MACLDDVHLFFLEESHDSYFQSTTQHGYTFSVHISCLSEPLAWHLKHEQLISYVNKSFSEFSQVFRGELLKQIMFCCETSHHYVEIYGWLL